MKQSKYRIPLFFGSVLTLFVIGVSIIDQLSNPIEEKKVDQPVIQTGVQSTSGEIDLSDEVVLCPVAQDIPIARYFYETGSSNNAQALDLFEGVYRQSQGVDYASENTFEVMAALSGTVVEVKKDAILGLCLSIECENGVTLIYQSLSDVGLEKGQTIEQGAIIGKSGHNIYESDLGNHVHFTIEKDGKAKNPLNLYNQKVSTIQ